MQNFKNESVRRYLTWLEKKFFCLRYVCNLYQAGIVGQPIFLEHKQNKQKNVERLWINMQNIVRNGNINLDHSGKMNKPPLRKRTYQHTVNFLIQFYRPVLYSVVQKKKQIISPGLLLLFFEITKNFRQVIIQLYVVSQALSQKSLGRKLSHPILCLVNTFPLFCLANKTTILFEQQSPSTRPRGSFLISLYQSQESHFLLACK